MISGMIASQSCQLPKMASQVPGAVHPDSRTKQLSRWVKNANLTCDLYFLPFVPPWLERRAAVRPLGRILEGSAVAGGGVPLMVSVIYAHRALPIGGRVIEGEKGHFPTETPLTLLREVKARGPETATVIFLGDGEFDSPELQAELEASAWEYVCRTAKNIQIGVDDEGMSLADWPVTRGQRLFRKDAWFTQAA